jgi:hypothetical protein
MFPMKPRRVLLGLGVAAAILITGGALLLSGRNKTDKPPSVAGSHGRSHPPHGGTIKPRSKPPGFGVESLPVQCGYGVAGSGGTTCTFVNNAFFEYWSGTRGNPTLGAKISVWSALGKQYYTLSCTSGDGVVDCTGQNRYGTPLDTRFQQSAVTSYTNEQAARYAASGKLGPGDVAQAAAPTSPLPGLSVGNWTGLRPSGIDFSADSGNIVTGISWSSWTATGATGEGTSGIQNCVPDCASGTITYVPTTITLSDPQDGHFTRMIETRQGQSVIERYGTSSWPFNAT